MFLELEQQRECGECGGEGALYGEPRFDKLSEKKG
jgi:hypothetical protein